MSPHLNRKESKLKKENNTMSIELKLTAPVNCLAKKKTAPVNGELRSTDTGYGYDMIRIRGYLIFPKRMIR